MSDDHRKDDDDRGERQRGRDRGDSHDRERDSRRKGDDPDAVMNNSLLVRNLGYHLNQDDLRDLFSKYGKIRDVYMPMDYYTRRPRGFAFVEFYDDRDASEAIRGLDRYLFDGRELTIVFAKERRKTPDQMSHMQGGRDDRRDDRRGGYRDRDSRDYRRDDRDRDYDRRGGSRRDDGRSGYRRRSRSRSVEDRRERGSRRDDRGGRGRSRSGSKDGGDNRHSRSRSNSVTKKNDDNATNESRKRTTADSSGASQGSHGGGHRSTNRSLSGSRSRSKSPGNSKTSNKTQGSV